MRYAHPRYTHDEAAIEPAIYTGAHKFIFNKTACHVKYKKIVNIARGTHCSPIRMPN